MVKRKGQGRPAKVRIYKETKAEEKAKLDAQDEHDAKGLMGLFPFSVKGKKRLTASFAGHIGKIIDRLDVPEVAAIIGTTLLVKFAIDESEVIRARLLSMKAQYLGVPVTTAAGKKGVVRPIAAHPLRTFQAMFGTISEEEAKSYEGFFPDWMDWLIAFTIAFIIVRHGGVILSELGGAVTNLSALVGLMMA